MRRAKPGRPDATNLAVRIDQALKRRLEERCEAAGLIQTWVVEQALKAWLEAHPLDPREA